MTIETETNRITFCGVEVFRIQKRMKVKLAYIASRVFAIVEAAPQVRGNLH